MANAVKFGRKARAYDPRVPHLSSLLAGKRPVIVPDSESWSANVPTIGMMMNDQLGCCAESAYYHARQTWTFDATGTEVTESDDRVVQLYELGAGYDPNNPSTDQGTVLQSLLTFLLNTGAPIGDGTARQKLLAWLEVDPRVFDDVFRTIAECGGIYIGMWVPDPIVTAINNGDPLPNVWVGEPNTSAGHCVWCPDYNRLSDEIGFESWNQKFILPRSTWAKCVEESYALLDPSWVAQTGKTPFGLTLLQTEAVMSALKK